MPPTTISGYLRKDVIKELDSAITSQNPENACCLAAELAVKNCNILIDHIIIMFCQNYISHDANMLERILRCVNSMHEHPMPEVEPRNAMCELIILLSCALHKHDTINTLLNYTVNCTDTTTITLNTIEHYINTQNPKYAIRDVHHILSSIPSGKTAAAQFSYITDAIWELLEKYSHPHSITRKFVDMAKQLYRFQEKGIIPMTTARKRIPLILYSTLLVAGRMNINAVSSDQNTTYNGENIDTVIGRSQALIGDVFDELLLEPCEASEQEPEATQVENQMLNEEERDQEVLSHQVVTSRISTPLDPNNKFDYLKMYTTYDYKQLCGKKTGLNNTGPIKICTVTNPKPDN